MTLLTDIENLGNYASVTDLPFTERKISYNRGYGNVVMIKENKDKIVTSAVPFNRLQPLLMPFGNHAPSTADPKFTMLNPQTNIAWDATPKYQ